MTSPEASPRRSCYVPVDIMPGTRSAATITVQDVAISARARQTDNSDLDNPCLEAADPPMKTPRR
jgi:hypothetical protein